MEPYKAKKLPFNYSLNEEICKLLCDAEESFGEYKGYLGSCEYDYKCFLECEYVNDLYYSFKIDNFKIQKEDIFHIPYMFGKNEVIEFNNLKNNLHVFSSDIINNGVSAESLHKINRILFMNCKKDNNTKGSGKYRKIQNYILKPGLAGSSISFIPPHYSELNDVMNNLLSYINDNNDCNFISIIIAHYQFEKIHPYVSGNGKIGRLLMPLQLALYKKEIPILFISESLEKLKNTYFTMLSGESDEDIDKFIKILLQCIIEQCNINIKRIKKINKIYKNDLEKFKSEIGGTTIYKIYPYMIKKVVFTTADIVKDLNIHINSVNKVLNKLVDKGYLIKEKKKDTNRVTFCYKNVYDVFME